MQNPDCLGRDDHESEGMWLRFLRWLPAAVLMGLGTGCAVSRSGPELERLPAEAVGQLVSWDEFNADWLAAALFAETNRIRREHGLPRYRSHRRLVGAADLQATTVLMTGVLSHQNPIAGRANVMDRVRAEGLAPRDAWENVASTAVRVAEGEGAVRIVLNEGRRLRLDDETGEPLAWPTYEELAARIVQQWMGSPGHRANILLTDAVYLACGVAMGRTVFGGEVVHSVQVFISRPPSS